MSRLIAEHFALQRRRFTAPIGKLIRSHKHSQPARGVEATIQISQLKTGVLRRNVLQTSLQLKVKCHISSARRHYLIKRAPKIAWAFEIIRCCFVFLPYSRYNPPVKPTRNINGTFLKSGVQQRLVLVEDTACCRLTEARIRRSLTL